MCPIDSDFLIFSDHDEVFLSMFCVPEASFILIDIYMYKSKVLLHLFYVINNWYSSQFLANPSKYYY